LRIEYDMTAQTIRPITRYYAKDKLFKNITLDEHTNESIEFTDKEGKVICKKVQYKKEGSVKLYASTYYVYDEFGNLVVVLPPEAIASLPVVFLSVQKTATFTRDNCQAGNIGSSIVYTVPANTYSSPVSQVEADQLAQNDVDTNGQAYANAQGTCPVFYNPVMSATFNRNNCTAGNVGSAVIYTVPVNKYSSLISQADVNQLAQNEINANGQPYANANGTCPVFYNPVMSGTFARNNCQPGAGGTLVTYTVSANTYSSLINQSDANQKAQTDINNNGQNYANANGACVIFYNTRLITYFTKDNCQCLEYSPPWQYNIEAGTFSSSISQADADQKAANAAQANGQAYANANGICYSSCGSYDKMQIGCDCITGTRVNTGSTFDEGMDMWFCTYYYAFGPYERSVDLGEYSSTPCPIN
jgi:hypothetical protein